MNVLDWFTRLPRTTQVILLVVILILFIVVALNYTSESNITNFLLVIQTIIMSNQPKR